MSGKMEVNRPRKSLKLRRSLFPNVPPYVQFASVTVKLESLKTEPSEDETPCQVWNMWIPYINQTVVRTVEQAGYRVARISSREYGQLQGGIWDFADGPTEEDDFQHMGGLVKINRLPGSHCICRKDQLTLNYKWLQSRAGSCEFNFLPESYALPDERQALQKAMKAGDDLWIVKPANLSCGHGIEIINRTIDLPSKYSKAPYSVQSYIKQPFLINNTKFDLRLYVLLTSIDPVRLYLYKDGLVRFATEQYDKNMEDIKNPFVHLTNYAINKNNNNDTVPQRDGVMGSTKWTLKSLRRYFEKHGLNWRKLWNEIEGICVKTVLCGHFDMTVGYEDCGASDYNCYKLFGFDVMLDEELKPWLLEVNSFPSMFPDQTDLSVNGPMVAEVFNILGFHDTRDGGSNDNDNDNMKTAKEEVEKLYSRAKSKEQEEKEETFDERIFENMDDILEELTPQDLRILIKSEEELHQAKQFGRIFPCKDYNHLLPMLDLVMYNDHLLAAWEEGKKEGRVSKEWLQELCKEGGHLLE